MKTPTIAKKTLLAALMAFLSSSAFLRAQEESTQHPKLFGGFGYFSFSAENLNLASLNQSLAPDGFNKFNETFGSWGGGGMFAIGNFLVGGGGAGIRRQSINSPGSSAILTGGYGQFSAGYLFRTCRRGLLYPSLGVGGGGFDLSVGPKTSPGDFSQQLSSPTGMMKAEAGGWFLDAELTYQHFFIARELQGFFIGARAGYRYSPTDWRFANNGQPFSNSPAINLTGLYLSLLIGGGGLGH